MRWHWINSEVESAPVPTNSYPNLCPIIPQHPQITHLCILSRTL